MNLRWISINSVSINSLILRDLFSLLNRKKQSSSYNPQYFEFYYKNKEFNERNSGLPIPNGIKVTDLIEKRLIILPKILDLSMMKINEIKQAFGYKFVRLANESIRFKAFKIDKNDEDKRKYVTVFTIYRDHIHVLKQKSMSIRNKNNIMIDICNVIDVIIPKTSYRKWIISYYINKKTHKMQTYEMEDKKQRDEIVYKLKYLCALANLR